MNDVQYKLGDELAYPFPLFNGARRYVCVMGFPHHDNTTLLVYLSNSQGVIH